MYVCVLIPYFSQDGLLSLMGALALASAAPTASLVVRLAATAEQCVRDVAAAVRPLALSLAGQVRMDT